MAEPVERGRYLVIEEGGGAKIYRATNLCERCSDCGCGEQREPLDFTQAGIAKLVGGKMPGFMMKMLAPVMAGMGKVAK